MTQRYSIRGGRSEERGAERDLGLSLLLKCATGLRLSSLMTDLIWLCNKSTCLLAATAGLTRTGVKEDWIILMKSFVYVRRNIQTCSNRRRRRGEGRADLGKGQSHLPTPWDCHPNSHRSHMKEWLWGGSCYGNCSGCHGNCYVWKISQ